MIVAHPALVDGITPALAPSAEVICLSAGAGLRLPETIVVVIGY